MKALDMDGPVQRRSTAINGPDTGGEHVAGAKYRPFRAGPVLAGHGLRSGNFERRVLMLSERQEECAASSIILKLSS